jgi:hypothetical protein
MKESDFLLIGKQKHPFDYAAVKKSATIIDAKVGS